MASDDDRTRSMANLASFVASTIGSVGEVRRADGMVLVASPVPVANGYVNAAFLLDADRDRRSAAEEARGFFAERRSPFVVWVPQEDDPLAAEVRRAGAAVDHLGSPDMVVDHPVGARGTVEVRVVERPEDFDTCARICEEGYALDGMAWLMHEHRMGSAPDTTWVIAWDGDEPLGAGCGHLHADIGGVYYIATPARNARRGVAGEVTAWLVNRLLDDGARSVVLQASEAGFPVYERLGFVTRGRLDRYRFD